MSWTTPPTWAPLDTVKAAELNTYVRDNTLYLYTPPSAKRFRTADTTIGNTTWTSPTYNSKDHDTDNIAPTVSATFTLNTGGIYLCVATVRFDANAAGSRRIRLNWNNGTIIAGQSNDAPSSGLTTDLHVTAMQLFSPGDTIITEIYQSSGGSVNVLGSNLYTGYSLAVHWVGAGS